MSRVKTRNRVEIIKRNKRGKEGEVWGKVGNNNRNRGRSHRKGAGVCRCLGGGKRESGSDDTAARHCRFGTSSGGFKFLFPRFFEFFNFVQFRSISVLLVILPFSLTFLDFLFFFSSFFFPFFPF